MTLYYTNNFFAYFQKNFIIIIYFSIFIIEQKNGIKRCNIISI